MPQDFLEEFARAERARREVEARAGRIEQLKHRIRTSCSNCERFDHGLGGWWEDGVGDDLEPRLRSLLLDERRYEFNPVANRALWGEVNHVYCKTWIARWGELAAAILALDELIPGTITTVLEFEPAGPRHRAMHSLFSQVLSGARQDDVVVALARVRDQTVPSDEDLTRLGGWAPRARFDLCTYFQWLLSSFGPTWDPPARPETSPPVLHETTRAVLDVLRDCARENRGVTAEEIRTSLQSRPGAKRLDVSEDRVRKIIGELREDGFVIDNPGGGTGYSLTREP